MCLSYKCVVATSVGTYFLDISVVRKLYKRVINKSFETKSILSFSAINFTYIFGKIVLVSQFINILKNIFTTKITSQLSYLN